MITKEIQWQSPSNIALIKYWGKRDVQLPMNPSLSMSLRKSVTQTKLTYTPKKITQSGLSLEFYFEDRRNLEFECKVRSWLLNIKSHFSFLDDYDLKIYSANSFPHSSGIASSASSFSTLALCLCSMEKEITTIISGFDSFEQKATYLARLGSGSASRSVFGGFVVWGKNNKVQNSSDEFAIPLKLPVHESFSNLCDSILVVSTATKNVSSTLGHKLMATNSFAETRYHAAKVNFNELIVVLENGNEDAFIRIVEAEALMLHAMFLTSAPGYILTQPGTISIIDRIRKYRESTGLFFCFTLDAGPNVHLLYPKRLQQEVREFIKSELLQYCENGFWIDDQMGDGPVLKS